MRHETKADLRHPISPHSCCTAFNKLLLYEKSIGKLDLSNEIAIKGGLPPAEVYSEAIQHTSECRNNGHAVVVKRGGGIQCLLDRLPVIECEKKTAFFGKHRSCDKYPAYINALAVENPDMAIKL